MSVWETEIPKVWSNGSIKKVSSSNGWTIVEYNDTGYLEKTD